VRVAEEDPQIGVIVPKIVQTGDKAAARLGEIEPGQIELHALRDSG
jgi:hypothetical protein